MAASGDLDHPLHEETGDRRADRVPGDLLGGHHPLDLEQDGLGSLHHQLVDEVRSAKDCIATLIGNGGMDERHVRAQWCTHEYLVTLSLIHISEPTRLGMTSYAV